MSDQRFKRQNPCPVCGGFDQVPRGKRERCFGYLSDDGMYAHCTRPERAGALEMHPSSLTYPHRVQGQCKCGTSHDGSATPRSNTNGTVIKNGHKPQSGPVVRDEIRDVNGVVVAIHCRRGTGPSKQMWWELPDGSKTLGGLAVEKLPLYGAERLAALPDGAKVAVVEGEPAKRALEGLGIPVAGTVTGAKAIPCDDVLQHLVRLSPILWPDNDDDGHRHMARIAARLVDLGCESVRVIDWPGAPDKGDAANAAAQGVDVRALIAASQPWTPDKAELPDEMSDSEEAELQITSLQDVVLEQVKPLWPKRIFLGKLAVLAGDPGLGKSYASLDIAARVSLGGPWPDGSGRAPRGNVLLLSAEDGLADTIKPRLELLGADMSRIYSLGLTVKKGTEDISLSLQEHLPQIEKFIVEKEIILLVVDPLLAFTGKADTHKTAEVRGLLSPIAAMAGRARCAILSVMHPNKNSSETNLIYRISASLDFAAAARSVMVVAKHPDNPDQRVMATVKCNLSAHPEPMAFGFTHDGCFAWRGVTELDMSRLMASADREDSSALDEAKQFLQEVLADGEMPARDVLGEARECSIHEKTLRRAVKDLGIDVVRVGEQGKKGGGRWVWRLPPGGQDLDGRTSCPKLGHL
ncbi:MAG TPA: AAA family ATPase [Dehalococcoidia bacterium]|nr:AAA family ATPase [Dehalococcoidia bacterium]